MGVYTYILFTYCLLDFKRLIYFTDQESSSRAVEVLQSKELNGRILHTRLDKSQAVHDELSHGIFIGNLPWDKKNDDLMLLFRKFAPISCNVLTNMYGKSRGFCLMHFATEEQAKEAVQQMNKVNIGGRIVEVAIL